MNHWRWVEDMAKQGVSVGVRYSSSAKAWEITIGAYVRSSSKATAAEAIAEAMFNQSVAGAHAIKRLDATGEKIKSLAQMTGKEAA
jgi:hypothetical protein